MNFLLYLFSSVALLALGVNLTKNSVISACGASLGNVLHSVLNHKFKAVSVGLGTTMLLQSSTATSLLVSSFLKKNFLTLEIALIIMLGADLGTAIMARVLTFKFEISAQILILFGTILYLGYKNHSKVGAIGGIMLGLGLILLALELIVNTTSKVVNSELTALLLTSLTNEITFAVIFGAVLAVICYSSLAAVLLTSVLCLNDSLTVAVSLAVVIGSNIGSCILEILGALRHGVSAKRVMIGNTIFKVIIAIICLLFLNQIVNTTDSINYSYKLSISQSDFIIWFHVFFNAVVCVVMLPFVKIMAKFLKKLLPDSISQANDPYTPVHLDKTAYIDPNLTLSNATREILRLGDFIQKMFTTLKRTLDNQEVNNEKITEMRNAVKHIAVNISDYLAGIDYDSPKQRKKMNKCLIASADIVECVHILEIMIKRLITINSNFLSSFTPQIRQDIYTLSEDCANVVNLAINSFFSGGKEQRQDYILKRDNCLLKISKFNFSKIGKIPLNNEQDTRFFVNILELLEKYRQLCTVFDPLLQKIDYKQTDEISEDLNLGNEEHHE